MWLDVGLGRDGTFNNPPDAREKNTSRDKKYGWIVGLGKGKNDKEAMGLNCRLQAGLGHETICLIEEEQGWDGGNLPENKGLVGERLQYCC